MPIPTLLLQQIGRSILAGIDEQVLTDVTIDVNLELASSIWEEWNRATNEGQKRAEIEALARATREELSQTLRPLVKAMGPAAAPETRKVVADYLAQVPQALRRRFRRPSDTSGTSIPFGLSLHEPLDLLAMLPAQASWFLPGDHPWDMGDFSLLELLEAGTFGESWKAADLRNPGVPPVLLKFCLHPGAKASVLLREAGSSFSTLDRAVKNIEHPGILQLRQFHRHAHPLCLEYEYFESGTLTSLIQEWQAAGQPPAPAVVARLLLEVADALGYLHQLQPPIVHGDLRPDKILVRQIGGDRWQCKVADLGLAEVAPGLTAEELLRKKHLPVVAPAPGPWTPLLAFAGTDPQLYLSPEVRHGQPLQPRDDVYTLGVLWYQMLLANVSLGRPGGLQWRKRLAERGLAEPLLELLEACFEDDPADRPADAAMLAEELTQRLAHTESTTLKTKRKSVVDPLAALAPGTEPATEPAGGASSREAAGAKPRARRAEVWKVFDTLEQKAPELLKTFTNSVAMKLVLIPAGTFLMGTHPEENGGRENELPRHEVTLTRPYYLAATPITQQQYLRVMSHNPARFHQNNGGGPDHPVESVTWENAVAFCRKLSELAEEKQARRIYRLPTEAEWEYACRAGTDTPFCYGTTLAATQANFDGNFPYGDSGGGRFVQRTTQVGQYAPNNFGLCDMHGNVWEWCADWLQSTYYKESPKRDPRGPDAGHYRVLRGGSWRNHAVTGRAGYRNGLSPRLKDSATGFRVLLEVEQ